MICAWPIGLLFLILVTLKVFGLILQILYLLLSTNLLKRYRLALPAPADLTPVLSISYSPKKRTLWKAYKTFNTDPLKKKYLECARMCRLAIIKHIADMESNIVSSNKVGNFYKYANKKLSCRSGIGVIRNSDGFVISDPVDQANCYNDFFASVFVKDNDVTPHIDSRVPDHVSLNNITFSRTDVFKILKGLNARSAGGPDHIPPILL